MTRRQSWDSQMIDGVFPTTPVKPPVLSKFDANVKMCPVCFRVVYNAVRICHGCGHEFYPSRVKK